jgi:hypothetical protein
VVPFDALDPLEGLVAFSSSPPLPPVTRAALPRPPLPPDNAAAPASAGSPGLGLCGNPTVLRTISCCTIVQRFVVIQYTSRPAGKLMMKKTKTIGSASMIMRWFLSIDAVLSRPEAICEPTYSAIRITRTAPVALPVRSGMKRKLSAPGAEPTLANDLTLASAHATASWPQMSSRRSDCSM